METTVHLISMPMSVPNRPSIQLGALKAFLDGTDLGVQVHTYSAFLGILVLEPDSALDAMTNAPFFDRVDAMNGWFVSAQLDSDLTGVVGASWTSITEVRTVLGEAPYFLLYFQKYLRQLHPGLEDESKPYGGLIEFKTPRVQQWFRTAFGAHGLRDLQERTDAYIETRIIPQLSRTGVNVVGFSCTFEQIYSSVYCLRYLQDRCPDIRFQFVFGGSAMGLPATQNCLRNLEIDALCVIGEGERKLEAIVRQCLDAETAPTSIRVAVPGVVHVSDPIDYYEKQDALYDGQVDKLDALPPPNYDEYFVEFRNRCESDAEYGSARKQVEIQLEGSRGCVFHCTFCNLNYLWDGYRSQTAAQILENVEVVTKKYGVEGTKLRFADNLCNWSGSLATLAVERGVKFPAFLELRAKYPEDYWVKLDRIGVWMVQVGIESYCTSLLEVMDKKTRAVDNVRAQKYITEMGIRNTSNLMTHYPNSTLEMIEESRRVCGQISHFSPVALCPFVVVEGSPLYNQLPRETRKTLRPIGEIKFSADLPYLAGYVIHTPAELALPPEVSEGWTEFGNWYLQQVKARPRFTVERVGDARRLVDTRGGETKESMVTGFAAVRVLDACHRPLTVEEIVEATSLGIDAVRAAIAELNESRALLHVDDEYITVALRPKAELVAAFENENTKRIKRPAALAVMQP